MYMHTPTPHFLLLLSVLCGYGNFLQEDFPVHSASRDVTDKSVFFIDLEDNSLNDGEPFCFSGRFLMIPVRVQS